MNKILEAALTYRNKGLSVIPVGRNKLPLISWKEFQSRLATKEEIEQWFSKDDVNIAVVTGKLSNYTVIDVESGGDISIFPETLMSKTGGGGYHLFYRYHQGVQNLVRIKPLTDVRNEGGYVIVPPSCTDKGEYSWVKTIKAIDFPSEVLGLTDMNLKTGVNDVQIPEYDGSEEGQRNDKITRYIGKVLPLFHPLDWESKCWPIVLEANKKNNPPLDETELRTTFESIQAREKKKPSFRKEMFTAHSIIEESKTEDDEIMLMSEVAEKTKSFRKNLTFKTGFDDFDNSMRGGTSEGDLIVITAQTGQGKTSFAQTLACNMSKNNVPILFFSYEVLVENLWRKFEDMGMSKSSIVYSPFRVATGSVDWIEARVLEGIKKFGIKIVIIDHLGYLLPKKQTYDSSLNSNYAAYLSGVARDLKILALKNNLVVMLLAHVKKTEKVTMNDIRDSGGIATEADFVFILERQLQKLGKSQTLNGDASNLYTNETFITMAKNRPWGDTPRILCEMKNSRFVRKYDVSGLPKI